MLITINGEEVEIADGSTIEEAIQISNALYTPGNRKKY